MINISLNKHHQFALAIFSICLVVVLDLSTVNKTIHDGLFHPNFSGTNPIHSGCSGHNEGACNGAESNNNSKGCDASCPVNIFSSGVLALDYAPEILSSPHIRCVSISEPFTSHVCKKEKKSHLVRGPPEEKQV